MLLLDSQALLWLLDDSPRLGPQARRAVTSAQGVHVSAATVTFGGLKGEIAYTDDAFGIDPDIQEMFYGDAAS